MNSNTNLEDKDIFSHSKKGEEYSFSCFFKRHKCLFWTV